MSYRTTVMLNPISSLSDALNQYAILLDVDGTILDLAPTPREVFVSRSLRETLARLWKRTEGGIAFVSGRPVSELDLIFSPLQLPTIGGHGAELRTIAGATPSAPRLPPLDPALKRQFAAIAEAGPGIILEDKGYSLALHYRLVPRWGASVHEAVVAVCADYPQFALDVLAGKSVVEVKPTGFNKGTGIRELMKCLPFRGRRPIFVGDDVTDEAAFAVLPEFDGLGFSVGRELPGVAGFFQTPSDVRAWLYRVADTVEANEP
jgi:trehalose 6-phosphate phosphatase